MFISRAFFLLGFLFAGGQLRAQNMPALIIPPNKIEYLNENRVSLPSEVGAVQRIETVYHDSVGGTVRSFYLPSGKLKNSTSFANVRKFLRDGTSSDYYENGQVRFQANYVAGQCVGDFVTYYPNGTLKRRDQHRPDQPVAGECFGPDGQPVAYYSFEQMPVYEEGAGDNAAIARAVMLNTKYPALALRNQLSGVIKVSFEVDASGRVQNIRTVEPATNEVPKKQRIAYQALEEAAMYAVRQLRSFKPGRQDGEPVMVSFTLPVTFRIQ
ncbi:TonB family protein [Hymenobacter antarcticus]|uniref:TonB C-terminal domain-containing protein n=1 Tax=Hymenobacter antarcticus TaxID=486270 RepID=A0ABP7P9I8_9BACT